MGTQRGKSNKRTSSSIIERFSSNRKLSVLTFVAVFGLIAASIIFSSQAAPKPHGSGGTTSTGASIYITPASKRLSASSNFTFQIWEDSLAQSVYAVQANLSYDTNVFDVVSIDSTGSAFAIQAQSSSSNGLIAIARGNIKPLTGKQLIAGITLRPKIGASKTSITFATGTALPSAETNKDILQSKQGGSYSFTR